MEMEEDNKVKPNLETHLVGNVMMYYQIDTNKFFWVKDLRLEFINILKSINQENVKVVAYVISKNSIHLILFSQDINQIKNFFQILKDKLIQFLQSKHNPQRAIFKKIIIFKNITGKQQFLDYIKLFQEIPKIKKSRKKEYNEPVISYEKDLELLDIPEIKEIYNLSMLELRKFLGIQNISRTLTVDNSNMKEGILKYIEQNNSSVNKIISTSYEAKKLISYLILNNYCIDKYDIAKLLKIRTQTLRKLLTETKPYIKSPLTRKGVIICLNY